MSKTIQLVLDDEALSTLTRLQEQTRASSLAEVLRDALGVYNALRDLLVEDTVLLLNHRSTGEVQPVVIPSLTRPRTQVVIGPRGRA